VECDGRLYDLACQRWDWFCSLTIRQRGASDYKLEALFQRWICLVGKMSGNHSLRWALRYDCGVDPRHRHLHAFVGGVRNGLALARAAGLWRDLCGGTVSYVDADGVHEIPCGFCLIRTYSPRLAGAEYLAAIRRDYEVGKSSMSPDLTLSSQAHWRAREVMRAARRSPLVDPRRGFMPDVAVDS